MVILSWKSGNAGNVMENNISLAVGTLVVV
jgi:hypothetical protein